MFQYLYTAERTKGFSSQNYKVMENTKASRRVKMTKKLLKNSLTELLESTPLSKVTIKQICTNADINRSTFYAYYSDQFQLLDEIENDVTDAIPIINLHIKEPRKQLLTEFFKYIEQNKSIYRVLLKNSSGQRFRDKIFNKLFGKKEKDTAWISQYNISDGIHFSMLMSAFGAISLVEKWIFGEINCTADELAAAIAEFIA